MSELSTEQLKALESKLVETKKVIEDSLAASAESAKPVSLGTPIGRLSRMDALQHQAIAKENRVRMTIQLQQINAALTRIPSGTYGVCLACEEPIPFSRLLKNPETTRCITCQSAAEK